MLLIHTRSVLKIKENNLYIRDGSLFFRGGGGRRMKFFLIASNLFCSFMQLQTICFASNSFQYLRLCKQLISNAFSSPLPHPQTLGLNSGPSLKLVGKNFECTKRPELCATGLVSVTVILDVIAQRGNIFQLSIA